MRSIVVAAVLMSLFGITGCSKNSVNAVAPLPTGSVQVMLTDAPANYDAVNLVISEVSANTSSGWKVLANSATSVDLLSLNNGTFMTLADAAIPAGTYTQLRVTFAAGSNVVVGGVSYPLDAPSGITVDRVFEVASGGVQTLQMDFDAAQSIQPSGPSNYMLTPVIRMLPASEAGAIAGQATHTTGSTSVQVADGTTGELVTSTTARPDGAFKIAVLPPGAYTVTMTPATGRAKIFQDVLVSAGKVTSMGGVDLPQ